MSHDETKPRFWKVTCTFQYVAYCKHEITAEMSSLEAFEQARHYMDTTVEELDSSDRLPLGWNENCVPHGPLCVNSRTIKQIRREGDIT